MNHIIGHKIVAIRPTTEQEREELFWDQHGIVLELDNNVNLLAAVDEEANGPGVLLYDTDSNRTYDGLLPIKAN